MEAAATTDYPKELTETCLAREREEKKRGAREKVKYFFHKCVRRTTTTSWTDEERHSEKSHNEKTSIG